VCVWQISSRPTSPSSKAIEAAIFKYLLLEPQDNTARHIVTTLSAHELYSTAQNHVWTTLQGAICIGQLLCCPHHRHRYIQTQFSLFAIAVNCVSNFKPPSNWTHQSVCLCFFSIAWTPFGKERSNISQLRCTVV
jgi:hypothetical protein